MVKSTASVLHRDKSLIANDFATESSIGKPTLLCKNLETATESLINLYLQSLRTQQTQGNWSNNDNSILAEDFNYLVRSLCSGQVIVREIASKLVHIFNENFPHLILQAKVFDNMLDVVSALYHKLNYNFTGSASVLELLLSESHILMPAAD